MSKYDLIVPALVRNQNNNIFYGISLTQEIIKHVNIRLDQQCPDNPMGYQRPVEQRRVKLISTHINSDKSLIPTNLIFSCRESEKYIQIQQSHHNGICTLRIKKGTIFYILDGSHRIAGFSEAMQKRADGVGIRDFLLNAPYDYACEILFLDREEERYNFQTITLTHKPMDSGVKRKNKQLILENTSPDDRDSLPTALIHGRNWSIFSNRVAETLNNQNLTGDNIFLHRVQLAGESKKPEHIIRFNTLATAIHDIEKFVDQGILPSQFDNFVRMYINYWKIIIQCVPALDDPKEYTIFHGTAVEALTNLLPNIVADFDIKSNGIPDIHEFEDLINSYNGAILDPDFWRRQTGRGSGYHGKTGKAALIRYLSGAETGIVI